MFKSGFFWIAVLVVLAGAGFIAWKVSQPKTESPLANIGESFPEIGRNHVEDIFGVDYNSNPPTSGPHFPMWSKKGIYNKVISDGYLIHSLEHGYLVASYNCDKIESLQSKSTRDFLLSLKPVGLVSAHEGEATAEGQQSTDSGIPLYHMTAKSAGGSFVTPETAPDAGVALSDKFQSQECKNLVDQMATLDKSYDRYIIVPRPDMDTPIALTAWTRLLKMNSWDTLKAEEFAKAYHNKGPEKTIE